MNKDLISQFANSEDCRNYMEFADYVLLVMQTDFPLLDYPYCVGQMQRMITPNGLGDLLNGRWSKQNIFEGTNFVLPNSEIPFTDRILIVTANYWKGHDPDSVAVIPFDITDDKIVIYFSDQKNYLKGYRCMIGNEIMDNRCLYGYNPKCSKTVLHIENVFDITFE